MNSECIGVERIFHDRILCKTIDISWEIIKYSEPQGDIRMGVFDRGGSDLQIIFPFNPYYESERNIFLIITDE